MVEPDDLFDLQVNGFGGVDFNDDRLTTEAIARACELLRQRKVAAVLATLITADIESMVHRIKTLVQAVHASPTVADVILGIHLEGPFISDQAGYVGTHPREAVIPASLPALQRLVDAGEGLIKLVTLAPERDSQFSLTRWLVAQGIVVSAGHCNPTLDQLQGSIDQGLSMFTHLGNACPLELPRHDNVIQRVLSTCPQLWICFIADGVHIPFPALRNYLYLVGSEKAIVVSDAISAAGLGPGDYSLGGQQVIVDQCLATWSADRRHLMGSACPLNVSTHNLVTHLGLTAAEAAQLTSANPRRALGLN